MPDLVITTTFTDTEGCCGGAACDLTMPTLLIDGTTSPYADSSAAAAAIADQASSGCYAEGRPQGSDTRTTFSSSFSSGTLDVQQDYSWTVNPVNQFAIRMYLTSADGLSVSFDFVTTGGTGMATSALVLYEDDQTTVIDSDSGSGNRSGTFAPSIATDGYYWLKTTTSDLPFGSGTSAITISVTGGASFLPCTVRAAYGGTPDYLVCT